MSLLPALLTGKPSIATDFRCFLLHPEVHVLFVSSIYRKNLPSNPPVPSEFQPDFPSRSFVSFAVSLLFSILAVFRGPLPAPSAATPPPTPYVHPIPPKVTQSTQESAEGRNPKNTKRNGISAAQTKIFARRNIRRAATCQVTKYRISSTFCTILPCLPLDFTHEVVHQHRSLPSTTLCLTEVHVFGTRQGQLTELQS